MLQCTFYLVFVKKKNAQVQGVSASHLTEMDQPGKVASPARGQLNRENEIFPVLENSVS